MTRFMNVIPDPGARNRLLAEYQKRMPGCTQVQVFEAILEDFDRDNNR